MSRILPVFKREFAAAFATPLASVFIVIFLFAMGTFTFYVGHFFDNGVADLSVFFGFHPWLYLVLIPALAMRMWAEERKSGTLELLTTLPLPLWAVVLGKYLAALAVCAIALALTFPIWLTVNILGSPDNGVILAGYIGSLLMAGGYLAIAAFVSATTDNQVVAFVAALTACFLFALAGSPLVLDTVGALMPQSVANAVASFGFITHFANIAAGALDIRDAVFFLSLIALFLGGCALILDLGRGGK